MPIPRAVSGAGAKNFGNGRDDSKRLERVVANALGATTSRRGEFYKQDVMMTVVNDENQNENDNENDKDVINDDGDNDMDEDVEREEEDGEEDDEGQEEEEESYEDDVERAEDNDLPLEDFLADDDGIEEDDVPARRRSQRGGRSSRRNATIETAERTQRKGIITTAVANSTTRRSSRTTKFLSSMTEMSDKEFFVEATNRGTAKASKGNIGKSRNKSKNRPSNADSMEESEFDGNDDVDEDDDADADTDDVDDDPRRSIVSKAKKATKSNKYSKATKQKIRQGGMNSKPVGSKGRKSPARRHAGTRKNVKTVDSDEDNDDDNEDKDENIDDDGDDEEDQQPLSIQRIIASRTEMKRSWWKICKTICTSEITYGSRWYQDRNDYSEEDANNNTTSKSGTTEGPKDNCNSDAAANDDNVFEERFLVKWADLSYLHCSWETQDDIVELVEGGKTAVSTFFRKSINGCLYTADERCDGDYFDPGFTQVERILEVYLPDNTDATTRITPEEEEKYDETSFGMILDMNNPNFDIGVGREFLVKWVNQPYSEASFEYERDLVVNDIEYKTHTKALFARSKKISKTARKQMLKKGEDENRRMYKIFGEKVGIDPQMREKAIEQYKIHLQQRVYKNGGQLRDYQAEGVAWMISNFVNGRSSILCDEMGLGKTLQTAATADLIINKLYKPGPILIIAPLSTLSHWYREFIRWTDLNTIIYHGGEEDRKLIRQHEFAYPIDRPPTKALGLKSLYLRKCCPPRLTKAESPWMVNIVITTPEMLMVADSTELSVVQWEALVVDEAHRMKNHNSKLAVKLRSDKFDFRHKILLTGTPIQNDVKEFWTILNFVDPVSFGDSNAFMAKYGDMKSKELVDQLHEEIRPYILRRLKEDVEKSVPPKEETLVEVELTLSQKQYYRALYEKNVKFLFKNKKKALDGPSLNNLAMQLRKVCNHVFLLNGIEQEIRQKNMRANLSEGDLLVQGSGKLVLMDKLLPRLKEEGHRVLIFSQFKIMLDILEDYLRERKMKFERIDGSITGNRRQQAIDRFQSADSLSKESPFIMMLTTRAGGVGINLTAADTCIIFDSDWNPQNDLQAQARCHRIGQTKSVKIYRLLSRKTYEMQMFHMSSLKMGLDQAVLNGVEGGSSGEATLSKDEVERLLRHGAYDIFNEEKNGTSEAESNDFVQLDIDSILQRRSRTVIHDNTGSKSGVAGGTFSKASFSVSKGGNNGNAEDIDVEDPDFWKKMVGEPKDNEDTDVLLSSRRQRKPIQSYSEAEYLKKLDKMIGDSDSSVSEGRRDDDDDQDFNLGSTEERANWGGSGSNEWKKVDAASLARTISTHGYGLLSWQEFQSRLTLEKTYDNSEIKRMVWSIIFATIKDVIDDEAESLRKRDQSNSDKLKTKQAESVKVDGGILGMNQAAANGEILDESLTKQKIFVRTFRTLGSWIEAVLGSAVRYAQDNKPRPKELTEKLRYLKSSNEETSPSSVFATNVWPSLKSRGWKVSMLTEGSLAGTSVYTFRDKNYSSPNAVLTAAQTLHPELKIVIETILKQSNADLHEAGIVAEKEREVDISLNTTNLDYEKMLNFFYRYAPLQLIVDRSKPHRIPLSKKILSSCNYLYSASVLMKKVSSNTEQETPLDCFATMISVDRRFPLPHPLWTNRHDAVLVQSIVKHGWIDQDSVCLAIAKDNDIKWGPPFDSLSTLNPIKVSRPVENPHLANTASRAAEFLNSHGDLIGETKGFNHHLIIRAYGLVKGESWHVDPKAIKPLAGLNQSQSVPTEAVELPTKKDLVKRAKVVITSSVLSQGLRKEESKIVSKYNFTVIDQSNPCNLLLAEFLRALAKESVVSKNNDKLCSLAIAEACMREDEVSSLVNASDATSEDTKTSMEYKNIIQHLELVQSNLTKSVRQYKNVLRVMLGEEPVPGKNPKEDLFPLMKSSALDIKTSKNTIKRLSMTTSERAVASARERLLYKYGTTDGMSNFSRFASCVDLTEIETHILTAVVTLGVPVWSKEWKKTIASQSSKPFCHWTDVGHFVHSVAKVKFDQCRSFETKQEKLLILYNSRKEVLRQANEYLSNPEHLAMKCILLLAKLQQTLSTKPVQSKRTIDGLGQKVYVWFESEIFRWAKCLDLLSDNGHPLALTAVDFLDDLPEDERVTIEIYSIFDQNDSRSVISQVAMMTRLKSIFAINWEKDLRENIVSAAKEVKVVIDDGETQLAKWDVRNDIILLHRLVFFGFSDELMSTSEVYGEDGPFIRKPYSDRMYNLPKGKIQERANLLVSELSSLLDKSGSTGTRVFGQLGDIRSMPGVDQVTTADDCKPIITGISVDTLGSDLEINDRDDIRGVNVNSFEISSADRSNDEDSDDDVVIIEPPYTKNNVPQFDAETNDRAESKKRPEGTMIAEGTLDGQSPEKKHRVLQQFPAA